MSTPADEAKIDINVLLTNTDKAARDAAVTELVNIVKSEGPQAFVRLGLAEAILKGLRDKKNASAREGACTLLSELCTQGVGHAIEPFVLAHGDHQVLNELLEALGDKLPAVSDAALSALNSLVKIMTPWALHLILPVLLNQIATAGKWQVKTGALKVLDVLVVSAADQMAKAMPEIVPVLAAAIWDTKADVKKAARSSLTKSCALVSNKDIEKFIPALISALINPVEEVPKCIQLLAATTFVSEVDAPTLSLMVPLLTRGCNERPTATKRKVAVITDNMAKLVDSEITVRPFIPQLLPALIKMAEVTGDPEARGVVNKAIATVRQVGNVPADSDGTNMPPLKKHSPADVAKAVVAAIKKAGGPTQRAGTNADSPLVVYISEIGAALVNARNYEVTEWDSALIPYVTLALPPSIATEKAASVVREVLEQSAKEEGDTVEVFEDEEEGEDLCNCTFSLAYGAKILLNTATLRLKRGHRYGLCGRNGSGKSTLMRAIHNGQVEGFPSPDEVRTFYVEHDIDGSEAEIAIIDWIDADARIQATREEKSKALAEVGFSPERQGHAIGSLSGGWKMKLALARAILFKADILLLDEPTNHLDVLNVQWLMDYLKSLETCTSIIVSHDSGFLDNVCTDILHLNRFKIKRYPGNLQAFVQRVPEAKAYYELSALEEYQFKFPDPPYLDGVKTKEKALMKMKKVGFQYPTSDTQQLYDVTLQVSLSSRVAVLGPNGAGKSTLVKLLIGQLEPNKGGDVWKHPNLVIGYVAQHAFHHIDNHLDETPLQYLLNRYQTGEDLEELQSANRKLTPEEEKKMKEGAIVVVEGQKRIIEDITNRKKLKQSFEYECNFKGLSSSENIWLSRDELIKRGFEKKILEVDSREAQKAGLLRPLVRKEIENHMSMFGLEAEFVTHNTMRGLSGGQKVKVVLAAATWRRPHVVILDEPTNYLDRESLAALIESLKTFEGGVLVITHNREFSESICSEVWAMRDGYLEASGHNWTEGQGSGPRIDKGKDEEEEHFDALGNKIEAPKKVKKLTSKEERKKKKERMARQKAGLGSDEEGDF
ncbi:translational elongation factor EF-1 alpha [Puccinia graminis f. sp. tritici]|uniref:Elongation factor 3 n=2 Tax=Puccinia graminis f. sp. tritici TaxID=56615 RepID=E3JVG1_PUCGT|nr:elongation factor EF-3 [Puccinia graminis f. sp. tritici CRL 75-36-700-3]EFP76036.1 elongation factor EF-3 [Puccinia graminis f. sp. tritici CRL 75-36-700-3]KAA1070058.1 translational elongation factor EF-1 alpha [Puccinia graminis f. sp. tritici]KAA1071257.1 translational elongation factor EF-1 alpha [Puccinia graminis f. sp. tritici]KAA1077266.1 translational elongation factor EF-1 alpha [Puccinia graminis f. sp. tritici]